MKKTIAPFFVVAAILLLLTIPAYGFAENRTSLEGQENAQLINAKDSVLIYRYGDGLKDNRVVLKLPVGEQVTIAGDTTESMLKISISDSICYVEKKYVAIDSAAYSTSLYTARNEIGLKIPLKWFFIALVIAALINLWYSKVEYKNPFIALFLYIMMNALFLGGYFCHTLHTVVDNSWTGGWWNGYLLSFVNSCGLAAVMIANKRAYTSVANSAAYECLSQDRYDFFSPGLLFWSLIITVLAGGVGRLISEKAEIIAASLVFFGILIYTLYTFGKHFLLGIFLFAMALSTFAICCLILKTLITWTFIIGCLAILFLVFGERDDLKIESSHRDYSKTPGYEPMERDIYIDGKGWRRGKVECEDVNVDGNYYRRGSDGNYHEV